jgi:hypothetical protein
MLLHTTSVSLEARLTPTATGGRAFIHEPTRAEADAALKCAHDLIALLLHKCNEFFTRESRSETPGACLPTGGCGPSI